MSLLSKLREHVHYAGVPGLSAHVVRAPAELPHIDVSIRQEFERAEAATSLLVRAVALDKTNVADLAASVPAPVPDIDVGMPRTIPDPPPRSGAKPPSAARA